MTKRLYRAVERLGHGTHRGDAYLAGCGCRKCLELDEVSDLAGFVQALYRVGDSPAAKPTGAITGERKDT